MKKLLSLLSLPLLAAGLVACSSDEGTEASPTFERVPESGAESTSTDSSADESSDVQSSESDSDSDSSSKGKSSKLKERDAEDFRATGFRFEQSGTVAWGVASPDNKVGCGLYEDSEIPSCYLRIDSPPILPDPEKLPWKANIATYDEKVGFVPASLVDGGDAVPTTALNAGERVDIEGMTFEAPSEGEFTVTFKGHQFTVNDKGEFVSDAYPFEQDSNGYGQVGTVCGELDAGNLGRQKVYAQVDGTNCRKAMDVLDQYVNHEWTMEERNSRGILKIDGWKCSVTEPDILQMPDPDARRLQCRDLSGTSRVILFNADKPNVPDLMPY
ncbi:hypothetical protein ACKFRM_04620 [Corynebacterium sp. YSMAA1_1_D6]|uniref:hypothetical protein n=1 Tax=Corynebacterium sp. YSMAA1_1_D6 TaxID=3383589 RepID=UPI0038D105C5